MTIVRNEFDKRIKDFSTIQSFKQYDNKYVGKSGYFTDSLCGFQDLKHCAMSTLTHISNDAHAGDYIFECELGNYRYFLPESYVIPEEPKKNYRPFSLEEFLAIFSMGNRIDFKGKGCCDEVKVAMFTGYITDVDRIDDKTPGACEVMLGSFHYSLFSLFEDFELSYNGRWQPFGVIDEDKEQGNEFRR